jgi:hypothetical protein
LRAQPASAIARTTAKRVRGFGNNDGRRFTRNCVVANSQQSSTQYAGRAIAMLIIPIQGEAGCGHCLQRNLAQKRAHHERKI